MRRAVVLIAAVALVLAIAAPGNALDEDAAWGTVPSPNRGTHENELAGVAVVSPSDIWAVGRYNSGRQPTVTGRNTLSLHWDGTAWAGVNTPNPTWAGADFFSLEDVAAVASNDVWAVGYAEDFASLKSTTLIERWNGSSWRIVPSPNPGGASRPNQLYAVASAGPGDAWAVGAAGYPEHALILRLQGTKWRPAANACPAPLNGVGVVSSTDVWAVGIDTTCHFDGTTWTVVPSPQPRPAFGEIAYILTDVSGLTSDDVWVSGYRVIQQGEGYVDQSIVEHWDGATWTLTTDVDGQALYGVEALGAGDVWAVGTDSIRGLVVHFDGDGWNLVPSPTPADSGSLAAVASESPSHLWAVGTADGGHSLVEESPSRFDGTVTGGTGVAFATVSWFGSVTGSVQTDLGGGFAAAGLPAGTYTFVATEAGCTPAQAQVTVTAGTTVVHDLPIHC